MDRGDVVVGECGSAFVVWGRTGPCCHLIPVSCAPANGRALRVRVSAGDVASCAGVWANPEARAHRALSTLEVVGRILDADRLAIAAAIDDERRAVVDLVERRRRRNIMAAARQARARRAA